MSKAQRILKLYATGKSTRKIADEVGCHDAYVRVVARQRAVYYYKGDRVKARKVRKKVYAQCKRNGASVDEAVRRSGHAYTKSMMETGRKSMAPRSGGARR